MTRHGLLLTAVATVTVPGLLAMLAVVGHERVTAERGVAAASLNGTPLSGPFPVAPATARAALRDNVAAVQDAAGVPVPVLNRVTVSQQVKGTQLLDGAADASLSTSYQGTELISQSGVAGSVKMISQVWHQGGGATLVETSNGTTSASAQPATADVASSGSASPEGVFGVTRPLVALLGQHYVAVYRGRGAAVGRAAKVVDLYRFDGSLAARYWLDQQTTVPLRRELFDLSDHVISQDSFVRVKFGALAVPRFAGAGTAGAWPRPTAEPAWVAVAPTSRYLASLSGQGWRLPGRLPSGLPLYAAASAKTSSGEVIDLEYSDGLYVASLFVQRGTLAPSMPGWQQVNVNGQRAFASGHSVAWAEPGFVYTLIADASPQTVTDVVGALRHGGSPGILDRLGRGFIRLARAINPFG